MPADDEPAPVGKTPSAPIDEPQGRPIVVPHIDFETPTGNELVAVREGYGLTPPAGNARPSVEGKERG